MKVAIIHEDQCIGCTKCIAACPVDAILGSNKLMHTVIAVECIGCQLCIAPCPVDCIKMIDTSEGSLNKQEKKPLALKRVKARKNRLALQQQLPSSPSLNPKIKKEYIKTLMAKVKVLKKQKA